MKGGTNSNADKSAYRISFPARGVVGLKYKDEHGGNVR